MREGEKFKCECGIMVLKGRNHIHLKTKMHDLWMQYKDLIKYDETRKVYNCDCSGKFTGYEKLPEHIKGEVHKMYMDSLKGIKMKYCYQFDPIQRKNRKVYMN